MKLNKRVQGILLNLLISQIYTLSLSSCAAKFWFQTYLFRQIDIWGEVYYFCMI